MENSEIKRIRFSEIKDDILSALTNKMENNGLSLGERVSLIDGFVNQPLSLELSGSFVIGGPSIPMIMLVGEKSGRIYYFALKAILPEIKI